MSLRVVLDRHGPGSGSHEGFPGQSSVLPALGVRRGFDECGLVLIHARTSRLSLAWALIRSVCCVDKTELAQRPDGEQVVKQDFLVYDAIRRTRHLLSGDGARDDEPHSNR